MTKSEFSERQLRQALRRELVAAAIDEHPRLNNSLSVDIIREQIARGLLPSEDYPAVKRADRYAEFGIDTRRGKTGKACGKGVIQRDFDAINAGEASSPSHSERVKAYTEKLGEAVGYLIAEFGWEESDDGEPDFMPTVRELANHLTGNE
jgi:hypothetical protein